MRRLKGEPGAWHQLELGGASIPIVARGGMSFEREAEVWSRPDALLFDYEPHWHDEQRTVMLLRPMQRNWRGRFPDGDRVTMPTAAVGSLLAIRLAPA